MTRCDKFVEKIRPDDQSIDSIDFSIGSIVFAQIWARRGGGGNTIAGSLQYDGIQAGFTTSRQYRPTEQHRSPYVIPFSSSMWVRRFKKRRVQGFVIGAKPPTRLLTGGRLLNRSSVAARARRGTAKGTPGVVDAEKREERARGVKLNLKSTNRCIERAAHPALLNGSSTPAAEGLDTLLHI